MRLPRLSLLAGSFLVKLWLFDDAGVFRYQETALDHDLVVMGDAREVGLVRLEHSWSVDARALEPQRTPSDTAEAVS